MKFTINMLNSKIRHIKVSGIIISTNRYAFIGIKMKNIILFLAVFLFFHSANAANSHCKTEPTVVKKEKEKYGENSHIMHNATCHYCRVSISRKRTSSIFYVGCSSCKLSYCSLCLINHFGEDKEITANNFKNFTCSVCTEKCCCKFNHCLREHKHCFTYRRTEKRHRSQLNLKWTKRKFESIKDEPIEHKAKRIKLEHEYEAHRKDDHDESTDSESEFFALSLSNDEDHTGEKISNDEIFRILHSCSDSESDSSFEAFSSCSANEDMRELVSNGEIFSILVDGADNDSDNGDSSFDASLSCRADDNDDVRELVPNGELFSILVDGVDGDSDSSYDAASTSSSEEIIEDGLEDEFSPQGIQAQFFDFIRRNDKSPR